MENDQKYSSSIALCMIEEKGHDFDLLRMEFKKILSSEDLSHAEKNTVTLLIKVIAVPFFPENPIEPYLLRYIDDDQYRSDHPFEFSKDDIEYLVSIASTFRNDIFKARVNDLIWFCIKKGNIVHADIAIDSYLASAFNRPATEWRSYTKQELERGYRLAKGINRTDKIQKIKKYLLDMLTTTEETDINLFFAIALFSEETGLLTDEKPDVISQIQRVADNLFNNSNFDLAIRYYELCARLYPSADVKTRVAMLMRSAECYECHARALALGSNGQKMMSHHWFEQAIAAYRRIDNQYRSGTDIDKRIEQLRHELLDAGKFIANFIPTTTKPIEDADDLIQDAQNQIAQQHSVNDAMWVLSLITITPSLQQLRESNQGAGFFSQLMSGFSRFSLDGRVIARSTERASDGVVTDPGPFELDSTSISVYVELAQVSTLCRIVPAVRQLHQSHTLDRMFIYEICSTSNLIPDDSLTLAAEAIWLGFEGRCQIAIFLIGPLIENIIRTRLKENGALTSTLKGVEHENSVKTLLATKKAADIFNENILFELTMIFADSNGPNLRNEAAHGLLTDASANSWGPVYGWWLFFKIIFLSVAQPSALYNHKNGEQ